MKKITVLLLSAMLILSLSACNGGNSQPKNTQIPPSPSASQGEDKPNASENAKILVAYFSMPDNVDNSSVVIKGEVFGNTQYVANLIQQNTNGDIFRIERKTPYPTDHATLLDVAKKEQNDKARPELAANVQNIEQYDIIFLGYPNWWADMPMVIYSFLETHDLSGKTIIPFNTHGGSGFSNTINTIAQLQPNATVNRKGFTVSRNNVQNCANDVAKWVKELGLTK